MGRWYLLVRHYMAPMILLAGVGWFVVGGVYSLNQSTAYPTKRENRRQHFLEKIRQLGLDDIVQQRPAVPKKPPLSIPKVMKMAGDFRGKKIFPQKLAAKTSYRAPLVGPEMRQEPWAQNLHQRINNDFLKGKADLVFLGDSITRGWIHSKEIWQKYYGHRKAINGGISSDRVEHLLWRVEHSHWESIDPQLVVLLIGVNNLALNTAPEIASGINQIVAEIKRRTTSARILLLGIFPSGKDPEHKRRHKILQVNSLLETIADGDRVFYTDLGHHFLNEGGFLSKRMMYDYLHLSKQGFRVWAEALEPKISSLLEKQSGSTRW